METNFRNLALDKNLTFFTDSLDLFAPGCVMHSVIIIRRRESHFHHIGLTKQNRSKPIKRAWSLSDILDTFPLHSSIRSLIGLVDKQAVYQCQHLS